MLLYKTLFYIFFLIKISQYKNMSIKIYRQIVYYKIVIFRSLTFVEDINELEKYINIDQLVYEILAIL